MTCVKTILLTLVFLFLIFVVSILIYWTASWWENILRWRVWKWELNFVPWVFRVTWFLYLALDDEFSRHLSELSCFIFTIVLAFFFLPVFNINYKTIQTTLGSITMSAGRTVSSTCRWAVTMMSRTMTAACQTSYVWVGGRIMKPKSDSLSVSRGWMRCRSAENCYAAAWREVDCWIMI